MTLLWDKRTYRADGTIMGVQRCDRKTFRVDDGTELSQEVVTNVPPEDWGSLMAAHGEAYGALDTHNKALERQISDERDAAEAAQSALKSQHADALRAKDEAHAIALVETASRL